MQIVNVKILTKKILVFYMSIVFYLFSPLECHKRKLMKKIFANLNDKSGFNPFLELNPVPLCRIMIRLHPSEVDVRGGKIKNSKTLNVFKGLNR